MSLEAKFAELKIDDVSSVVDAVKKDGAKKSGLAAGIEALKARCVSKDADEALSALKTVKALCEECPEAQAFTKECLTACKYSPNVALACEDNIGPMRCLERRAFVRFVDSK